MAIFASVFASLILLLLPVPGSCSTELLIESVIDRDASSVPRCDVDLLEFPLNLEYLGAEFFLFGSMGHGLDRIAPNLTMGGPAPIGARKANLDPFTQDIALQFGWQQVGHLRAIKNAVRGFPRPLLDLSARSFAKVIDKAFGEPLNPPFDPYASSTNFLIASYLIPYIALTGYVGSNPNLQGSASKRLAAGLLGVKSGQDAIIRTLLYQKANEKVHPYGIPVAAFTNKISQMRNNLGRSGLKDEGLLVPKFRGTERKIRGNVLAGNEYSIAFDRTPEEILRIVYGGGHEGIPGGFFPNGANGRIAGSHLHNLIGAWD
ncbi:hypothetical protein WN944_025291 [Citrus x changshan-huyou]|uniref:Desiccation-related protein PCC13-62 n=1 Tax=Citrus x changshan-huyou TaxID=2935761 RepID=A0AAP0QCT3_9ROSI